MTALDVATDDTVGVGDRLQRSDRRRESRVRQRFELEDRGEVGGVGDGLEDVEPRKTSSDESVRGAPGDTARHHPRCASR